ADEQLRDRLALRSAPAPARAAAATRGRARARARQGDRDRRRHPDQPARHRAADHPAAPARRLGGQGEGDGHRLVGGRSVPEGRPRHAVARQSAEAARVGRRAGRRRGRLVTETISSTAWYVYAFVGPPPDVRALEDLHGVSDGGLALVGDDSLAAVVGGVSLHEFGETTLPERLNDRGWLEEKARAHEHVVEQLGAATTVVPLRFGSIYRELSDVEALVERRRADVGLILEHIRGRMEL